MRVTSGWDLWAIVLAVCSFFVSGCLKPKNSSEQTSTTKAASSVVLGIGDFQINCDDLQIDFDFDGNGKLTKMSAVGTNNVLFVSTKLSRAIDLTASETSDTHIGLRPSLVDLNHEQADGQFFEDNKGPGFPELLQLPRNLFGGGSVEGTFQLISGVLLKRKYENCRLSPEFKASYDRYIRFLEEKTHSEKIASCKSPEISVFVSAHDSQFDLFGFALGESNAAYHPVFGGQLTSSMIQINDDDLSLLDGKADLRIKNGQLQFVGGLGVVRLYGVQVVPAGPSRQLSVFMDYGVFVPEDFVNPGLTGSGSAEIPNLRSFSKCKKSPRALTNLFNNRAINSLLKR